jgi:hypothetical protein
MGGKGHEITGKEVSTISMDESKSQDFVVRMPESKPRGRPTQPRSRRISILVNKVAIPVSQITHNPAVPIMAYGLASISMTVTNKYCVSGPEWNMNFFLLALQVSLPFVSGSQLTIVTVRNLHINHPRLQIVWTDITTVSLLVY